MKLSIKGLALASGIVWGAALLLVGICNLVWSYGAGFLQVMDSLYPGYGAVCGAVFAWLYNKLS